MMKKMRLRYQEKEDNRRLTMIEKKIRKEKERFYARTDKDEQEDEAFQRFLNLAAELEG